MNASAPSPKEGGGSNGEFIVHTKHTCDMCFQRPIIGKRFKSDVNPNFDLCSRCFQAYSGPDIGLTEEVLMRDKKVSRDFVLKLKIINGGEVQIRRVKVSEVWGKSVSHLSFEKMMSLAASFVLPEKYVTDAGLATFTAKAKVTYIDEDGDEITMTSNDELDDAFLQVLLPLTKNLPSKVKPFVITVTVPQDQAAGKASVLIAGKKGMPKRIQVRKIEPNKKLFALSNDKSPSAGCKSKNSFIHARHTCDGCQKTPIVGTRFHATKIPDFDLCATCFEKYDGDDLDFKPEIQERDRCMQQRWLNKGLCHASGPNMIAGIWDSAHGDLADFLKKVQDSGGSIESATVYHVRPTCKFSASEMKSPETSPTKADADSLNDVKKSVTYETLASSPSIRRPPESPTSRGEGSFSSDADDNGSIAKAIGHTLDDCVAAIEAAMIDGFKNVDQTKISDEANYQEPSKSKIAPNYDVNLNHKFIADATAAAIATAAAAVSVASSIVSSMTDIDEAKKVDVACQIAGRHEFKLEVEKLINEQGGYDAPQSDAFSVAASVSVPSVNDGASFLTKDSGCAKDEEILLIDLKNELGCAEDEEISFLEQENHDEKECRPCIEDAADGEDEWSVVDDDAEKPKPDGVKEQSMSPALSPVVIAKWDTELRQLHEMGFFDDRSNIDSLEHLEAAHIGVDSTEKVSVNAAVEHLLGRHL